MGLELFAEFEGLELLLLLTRAVADVTAFEDDVGTGTFGTNVQSLISSNACCCRFKASLSSLHANKIKLELWID